MSHPNSYAVYRFEEMNGELKRAIVPWKDPKYGEIVVKVLACGICGTCASCSVTVLSQCTELICNFRDDHVRAQFYPTGFPRVPGHEIVGEVVAVGPGETILKVGDRVGTGWHGGHCGRCTACRFGDFNNCEKEDVNGVFTS